MFITLLQGGRSVESTVSRHSAQYLRSELEALGHHVTCIDISDTGDFTLAGEPLTVRLGKGFAKSTGECIATDLYFPMCHGFEGEDGTLQSLIQLLHAPCASTDITSSAIGMHKAASTALASFSGIPTLPFATLPTERKPTQEELETALSLSPHLILKPEAGGSSIGIEIVRNATAESLLSAWQSIKTLDRKLFVQPYLSPLSELECAVYEENGKIIVVGPGRLRQKGDYVNYQEKYDSTLALGIETDPPLPREVKETCRELARRVWKALSLSLYTRIDFFFWHDTVLFNEVNTIPGMTASSAFPHLLNEQGIGMRSFLPLLLKESTERFAKEQRITHTYE